MIKRFKSCGLLRLGKERSAVRFFTLCALMLLVLLTPFAEAAPSSDITTADVFVQVSKVHAELEILRFDMGKPKSKNLDQLLVFRYAAPREVYYQALTLFEKSNQLGFDHLRVRTAMPATPAGNIHPADVFRVVDLALKRIRAVKKHLGIQKKMAQPALSKHKNSADALMTIVHINRQLNLLLDQQFTPKAVFKKVNIAISYAAKLQASFPNVSRIPDPEEKQVAKRPVDVLNRLLEPYKQISLIAVRSKITRLELELNLSALDIASLIVSELADMNANLPKAVYQFVWK